MSEWQPIETAPKDGTKVLLFKPCKDEQLEGVIEGYWYKDMHEWCDFLGYYRDSKSFTHWRPAPEPPNKVDKHLECDGVSTDDKGRLRLATYGPHGLVRTTEITFCPHCGEKA